MDGMLEIVRTVADLGFTVIAAGFVIWQVKDMYKSNKNKEENTQKRVEKSEDKQEDRYDKLLEEFHQNMLDNQKKSDEKYEELLQAILKSSNQPHVLSEEENSRMTKIDGEINIYLERALRACNASRVFLVKYHNGGNDMLGNSILKMSMSNEKCAAGVINIINSFQNQLRSTFSYWTKELSDNGYCFIENVEDIKDVDNSIYQYMMQEGVKAKFGIAVKNNNTGSVIGYVCIDFAHNSDVDLEQVKHCLNDKKMKIETLLNI